MSVLSLHSLFFLFVQMESSINKAVAYLEREMPSLTNPYAVAMTSYALANENKFTPERKRFLYTFVKGDFE